MKLLSSYFVVSILLGAFGLLQATSPQHGSTPPRQSSSAPGNPPSTASGNSNARIAPGSVIPVRLTTSIDAKKTKTGDTVEAKVTQDMKDTKGDVLVAKDAKITGHVTEAQARNKQQKESQVAIAFDRAVLSDAGEVTLPMSIQAIVASANPNDGQNPNAAAEPANPRSPTPNNSTAPSGRSPGTDTGIPPQASGGAASPNSDSNTRPPITAQTQGVIGAANLKLSSPENATAGSMISSEKGDVKLESGTMLLLRVQ